MRDISEQQVLQIGLLARLKLAPGEVQRLTSDLNVLIGYFEELKELDTSDVAPTFHLLDLTNVTREDRLTESLPVEEVLRNAPAVDGPFFVVPRVVDTD